jgi:hypothetical protein
MSKLNKYGLVARSSFLYGLSGAVFGMTLQLWLALRQFLNRSKNVILSAAKNPSTAWGLQRSRSVSLKTPEPRGVGQFLGMFRCAQHDIPEVYLVMLELVL